VFDEKLWYGRLCEAFFAEAISRLPNQEVASLRNARKDEKDYVFK